MELNNPEKSLVRFMFEGKKGQLAKSVGFFKISAINYFDLTLLLLS